MIEVELKELLEKNFMDARVEVVNESHRHVGHSGSPETGQSHFNVLIVSDDFKNQSRVVRHQRVNGCVESLFDKGLHALSLKLFTVDEYDCKL